MSTQILRRAMLAIALSGVAVVATSYFIDNRTLEKSEVGGNYNWEASKVKLRAIGAALQIFRSEQQVKVVSDRNGYQDAGLPLSLGKLYRTQGKPWSINRDMFFADDSKQQYSGNMGTHFFHTYIVSSERHSVVELDQAKASWAIRGESMPVLLDYNMYSPQELSTSNGTLRVIVLRLDGTVEEVHWNPKWTKGYMATHL